MNGARLVLATDLDGTFAGGEKAASLELITALATHASTTLIYVTGRSVDSARELIAREGLPLPTVLIADVGTSVLHHAGPQRMERTQYTIAARWPGAAVVRSALAQVAGLEPQDVEAPYRVSYWIAANRSLRAGSRTRDDFEARAPNDLSLSEGAERVAQSVAARASAALHRVDVDTLVSANVYLDILPSGVNKGSTLRRVLEEMQIDAANCIVAGDSLNDRSLFEIGACGIVVGNCEPALRTALAGRRDIYCARAAGAAGILEGLRFLRLLPPGPAALEQGHFHGQ